MGGKGGTAHFGGVYGSGTPGAEETRDVAEPVAEELGDTGERVDEDGWGRVESMLMHRLTWRKATVDRSTHPPSRTSPTRV